MSAAFHPLNFIRPSIESCQTLVILALQQHGLGEASNAAMLCNIAAGMAIELRLNEAGPLTADYIEIQVNSRLWWNLYVLDKVLAHSSLRRHNHSVSFRSGVGRVSAASI
jgi:hypothetical protein